MACFSTRVFSTGENIKYPFIGNMRRKTLVSVFLKEVDWAGLSTITELISLSSICFSSRFLSLAAFLRALKLGFPATFAIIENAVMLFQISWTFKALLKKNQGLSLADSRTFQDGAEIHGRLFKTIGLPIAGYLQTLLEITGIHLYSWVERCRLLSEISVDRGD